MLEVDHPPALPDAPDTRAPEVSPHRLRSLARAAQHDILRRLAPTLRHDMVVHLQSLGMTADALTARVERGAVGPEDIAAVVSKMNRLARQAVARCVEVCTWMEPAEDDAADLHAVVDQVVHLLSPGMNFRGFALRHEAADAGVDVARSAVRFLLAGAILTLADAAPGPGALVVRSRRAAGEGRVEVEYLPEPEASFTQLHEPGDAPLSWVELQALARLHDAHLQHRGQEILLRFPRTLVTTPLKMAPV